ncbi:Tigger transposable element-derived protein 1-like 197, partial [Homarus americanus]
LARQAGFDELESEDIEDVLASQTEELTNEDLQLLTEHSPTEVDDDEEEPQRTPTSKRMTESFNMKTFNIGDKAKILNVLEHGASASVATRCYGVNESTIRGIRQKADMIHAAFAKLTVSKTTQHLQPPLYQEIEDTLEIWIENMQRRKQFWKNFMIKDAVTNIALSWKSLFEQALTGVWHSLWPDVVQTFKGFTKVKDLREIVLLSKKIREDPRLQ